MIQLYNKNVKMLYIGNTPVQEIYLNSKLVYSRFTPTVVIYIATVNTPLISINNNYIDAISYNSYIYNYIYETYLDIITINIKTDNKIDITDITISINCNTLQIINLFSGLLNANNIIINNINTSNIINMNNMFNNCKKITSLDLSKFDTSNVKTMDSMFYNCTTLKTLDLSNFNTTNVNTTMYMFANCTSLKTLDLSNFSIDAITNIMNATMMFSGCNALTLIRCKQTFKDWCLTNKSKINLPTLMQDGGSGTWEIIS